MSLDELDLALIEELKIDARQPVRAIARKLGLKRSTVRYRLDRLTSAGILKIICTGDTTFLGYHFFILFGIRTRSGRTNAVADYLASLDTIKYICLSAGRYNILAWGIYREESDLSYFITKELAAISDISSIETMPCFQWFKVFFQPQTEKSTVHTPSQLSDLDLSLIKAMQQDPRQTITNLAQTIGCSQVVARNTLKKLKDGGNIRFIPTINPTVFGSVNGAVILIKPELDKVKSVVSKLSSFTTTMHISLITGQWQIFVVAQFQDNVYRYDSIIDELNSVPGIIEFEILPLLKILKFTPNISWLFVS